jgi:8-oxo-dGTP pyrophosphatase MutT (NUDIX family)
MNYKDYYKELFAKLSDPKHKFDDPDAKHREALQATGFWGERGAGCIFLARDTRRLCFPLRGRYVREPLTWGVWGGAIDEHETPKHAVEREVWEETGYVGKLELIPLDTFTHGTFKYYNFLAVIDHEFEPDVDIENLWYKWVKFGKWPKPLHFGLKWLLNHSGKKIKDAIDELNSSGQAHH